jgi:hypothetical protein
MPKDTSLVLIVEEWAIPMNATTLMQDISVLDVQTHI